MFHTIGPYSVNYVDNAITPVLPLHSSVLWGRLQLLYRTGLENLALLESTFVLQREAGELGCRAACSELSTFLAQNRRSRQDFGAPVVTHRNCITQIDSVLKCNFFTFSEAPYYVQC